MIEREPQPEFQFNIGDEVFNANPGNSRIYRHQHPDDAMFDHLYLITNDDPEEPDQGYFVFRKGIENAGGDFDELIESMQDLGWRPIERDTVAAGDRAAYFMIYEPHLKTYNVTPRQDRRVAFLGYLLTTGKMTPDDFLTDGELFL